MAPRPDTGQPAGGVALDDLVLMGLERNPRLAQAAIFINEARGQAIQAGLYPNPTFNSTYDELGDRTGPGGINSQVLNQEIVTAHKLRLSRNAATRGTDQATLQFAAERYLLLAGIRGNYFEVLTLQRRIEILDELVKLAEKSVDTTQKLLEAKQVARLARSVETLNNLAGLCIRVENLDRARPLLEQIRENCKRRLGNDHPQYAASLNNLGLLYLSTREYDLAESVFLEAMRIYRDQLGDRHELYVDSLEKLGRLRTAQGDYAAAESLLRQALEIDGTMLSHDDPNLAQCLESYAALLRKMERNGEARTIEARAKEIRASRTKK